MIEDTTSWHHKPIGQRVMSPRPPYFMISASQRKDRDALARRRLAALAGL
jgi:hypothetical protein